MKEAELIRRCRLAVAGNPRIKVIKIHGSMFSEAGTPDLVGSSYGRPFAIECKVGDNVATPIQKKRLEEWKQAEAITGVVYMVEEFMKLIGGRQ